MPNFSFVILYVESPPDSAKFYAGLLDAPIIDQSPTFAMLPLRDGVMLGLWSRHTVEPKADRAWPAPARWPSPSRILPPSATFTPTGASGD